VPREPGGPPEIDPPRFRSPDVRDAMLAEAQRIVEARTCTSLECGGPRFCVHRYMPPVSRDAVYHWRHYAADLPVAPGADVARARHVVDALLRAPPSTWARCGADAERLAVLGYTLETLVAHHAIEELVDGLELDWPRLQALGFHAALLAKREHFPVFPLARAGLSAVTLLRSNALSYRQNASVLRALSHEELRFLGFTAPLLVALGMDADDVLAAVAHEHIAVRGLTWWARAMACNAELLEAVFDEATVGLMSHAERVAYSSLAIACRSKG
jgi:hypothetical protein